MNRKRILLCEDNEFLRKTLVILLQNLGHSVFDFATGEEVKALSDSLIGSMDVLLTDIDMPGSVDGIELAVDLKSDHEQLGICLMTGHSISNEVAESISAPLLRKPFSPANLCRALASIETNRTQAEIPMEFAAKLDCQQKGDDMVKNAI